jgi:hypothetical protein
MAAGKPVILCIDGVIRDLVEKAEPVSFAKTRQRGSTGSSCNKASRCA